MCIFLQVAWKYIKSQIQAVTFNANVHVYPLSERLSEMAELTTVHPLPQSLWVCKARALVHYY